MRLLRLDLLRYGHFRDVSISFDEVKLCVVLGENEAGKSTALAAIADALFGFAQRTEYDFLHGAAQLRVGVALRAADGSEAVLRRRKGRGDTLRDADDATVPEHVMRRFLGDAGRAVFERGFGLNAERLRAGGAELLASGGEAGEVLLAGIGLSHVRRARELLDEEAKKLVGDGRGQRRLSQAVETWRLAQRDSEARALKPRAWEEAEARLAELRDGATAAAREAQALAAEDSRLQRVRRVAPILIQLDRARETVALLAETPRLPPDAAARLQTLSQRRRDAERDAARAAESLRQRRAVQAALRRDPAILAVQDEIEALREGRSLVAAAVADLPKVSALAVGHRADVAAALAALRNPMSPEAARDAVPGLAPRRVLRDLAKQHGALDSARVAAWRDHEAAVQAATEAQRRLDAAPAPESPALLRQTAESVRAEGRLDDEHDRLTRLAAAARERATTLLGSLPLWRQTASALAACPLPLPEAAQQAAAGMEAAAQSLAEAQREARVLAGDIAALRLEEVRLARGETVPTPDVISAARGQRDETWRAVRRSLEARVPDNALADRFEVLRDDADRLADRRAAEAQRVSDFLACTARRGALEEQQAAAVARVSAEQGALEAAETAWRALWAAAGIVPEAPAAMVQWRRLREDVLAAQEAAAQAEAELAAMAARRERACVALAGLLGGQPTPPLADLLRRAVAACEAAEARLTLHEKAAEAVQRAREAVLSRQAACDRAEAAMAAWRTQWAAAADAVGLPVDCAINAAEVALDAWEAIERSAAQWRIEEGRVAAMQESVARFAAAVAALPAAITQVDSAEGGGAPLVIAARLARRLDEARNTEAAAQRLMEDCAAEERVAAEAHRAAAEAEDEIAALRSMAGAVDDARLAEVIEEALRRDSAKAEVARLTADLIRQGDGLDEPALRHDAANVDADQAAAELDGVAARRAALAARQQTLAAEGAVAERELEALRVGNDAAVKAQEAAFALADAREAAERYARLHVARVLLAAGIERFRAAQQAPMLRAAEAHFSALTAGRYVRLDVDEDDRGRASLRAVRDEGRLCGMDALSEGTRDQLFLALRIAAVETHAAQAEPLPFVADDLLVTFDDKRAAAALDLLIALGQRTQVLLFTHHEHIAALAAQRAGTSVVRLPAATA